MFPSVSSIRLTAVFFSLFLPLQNTVSVKAQDATVAPETDEEETLPSEGDIEERQRSAESFLFPETSQARARVGRLTPLRNTTLVPSNIIQSVTRPDDVLRVGNFRIQPSLGVSASYDDNADASNDERDDEIRGNVSGSLRAQSLFERHSLGAQADVVSTPIGGDNDDEIFDWLVGVDGRLDLTSRSSLSAAIAGTYGTEDSESAEAVENINATGDEATVTEVAGSLVYAQQLRRLGWALSGRVGYIDADAEDSDFANLVDERDSTTYGSGLDLTYSLSSRLGLFSEFGYELSEFDSDGEGGSRDSQTVDGSAGFDMRLGRTLRARLGGGYSTVFFDDSERDTSSEITVDAALDGAINLDRVTVLSLSLQHDVERTTVEDSALVTTTSFGGTISRELSSRSAVQTRVEGARSDFLDLDRSDYDISAQLAYSLALTRTLSLNASYRYSQRFSDDDDDEYYRNIVAVGFLASF